MAEFSCAWISGDTFLLDAVGSGDFDRLLALDFDFDFGDVDRLVPFAWDGDFDRPFFDDFAMVGVGVKMGDDIFVIEDRSPE